MDLFQLWGSVGIRTADAFRALDQVEERVNHVAQNIGRGLQNAGDKMQDIGNNISSGGATMTAGLTAPIAGIAFAAGKAAMDVQKASSDIATSLGVSTDKAEALSKSAQAVWKQGFGENLEEVNSALITVKQNMQNIGNGKELETVTRDSMLLAKTFDSDINEVTRAAENLMTNFGISSQKAYDMMAAGGQRGLNFSNEMFDNLSEYTPLFKSMGYSAEEMFGILERGSKAGVYNLDYVNDVMKEFGIRIKDGSKSTDEAMSVMSKETFDLWEAMNRGEATAAEVSTAVVKELQGMDDQVTASQLGVALFGTKWEDLESSAMYAMLGTNDAMSDFDGKMKKLAKDSETFEVKWNSFKRTAQSALIPIGTILLDIAEEWLPKVAKAVEKVAKGFAAMPEGMQKFIIFGGLALAAIGPILLVLGTMVSGLGAAVSSVGMLTRGFGALSSSVLRLPKLIAKVFGAFGGATTAQRQLDDLLDSSRNGGAGGGGNGGQNRPPTPDVSASGGGNNRPTPRVDVDADRGGANGGRGAKKNPFAKLPEMATKAAKGVGKAFSGMGKMLVSVGSMFLPMLANPMGLAITAVIAIVAGGIYLLVKHWDTVKTGAIKAFTALGDFFKKWGPTILAFLLGPIGLLVKFMIDNWDKIKNATTNAFNSIRNTISNIMSSVAGFISNVLGRIESVFVAVWSAIKGFITSTLGAIKSVIISIWNAIKSFITSTMQAIKSIIVSIWNAIKAFITSTMNAIKSVITSIWNAIKSFVTTTVNAIKSVVVSAFNAIKSGVTSAMSATKSFVTSMFNGMKSAASSAASFIKSSIIGAFNAIKNLASEAVGWGADIVKGLIKGLTNGLKNVGKAVGGLASAVGGTFKRAMGIKSPSRLFKKFGGFIGEGLAIGMENMRGMVARASEYMADGIVQPGPIPLPEVFPTPPGPRPVPGGNGAPTGGAVAGANTKDAPPVVIQSATFQINLEKVHTDEDVNKMRSAIQTVVADDLFGMAVRNV